MLPDIANTCQTRESPASTHTASSTSSSPPGPQIAEEVVSQRMTGVLAPSALGQRARQARASPGPHRPSLAGREICRYRGPAAGLQQANVLPEGQGSSWLCGAGTERARAERPLLLSAASQQPAVVFRSPKRRRLEAWARGPRAEVAT